ncbi:MAG: CooT family nickel-binding protein [Chitinophagales bacterium]
MCEANVYMVRDGREELVMEKVDRIIPGEDQEIMLESVFGERKIVKARIREMQLVHHRIILDEIRTDTVIQGSELWLEPASDHGHFHPGDQVILKLFKGHNMQAIPGETLEQAELFVVKDGAENKTPAIEHEGHLEVNLGEETDGLITVYSHQPGTEEYYAKVIVEIGHHHHHGIKPLGMPLEIVPLSYSHVHLGDQYEIQVIKDGIPLGGAEVLATYSGNRSSEYPYRLVTDEEGKARVFLSARGNWLFSVTADNITSTYTLIKSF